MTDLELFACFNVDMSQYMKKKDRMGRNTWLWSIVPIVRKAVGSAKNTSKNAREGRIQQLKVFYEKFEAMEISPFG